MPVYSYKCPKCSHCESLFKKIGEHTDVKCSKCGEATDRVLKGSGFAISGPGVYKEGFSGTSQEYQPQGKIYKGEE